MIMGISDLVQFTPIWSDLVIRVTGPVVMFTRVTAKGIGPHDRTGPESTAWLLPLKGTAGEDMSANKWTRVRQWSCVGAPVHHRVKGPGSDVELTPPTGGDYGVTKLCDHHYHHHHRHL